MPSRNAYNQKPPTEVARKDHMEATLANGQGNPYVSITQGDETIRVYFCKDGGIIQRWKPGCEDPVSIGCRLGCRSKDGQTTYEEAAAHDGIPIMPPE